MNEEYFSNGFFNLEIAKGFGTLAIYNRSPWGDFIKKGWNEILRHGYCYNLCDLSTRSLRIFFSRLGN